MNIISSKNFIGIKYTFFFVGILISILGGHEALADTYTKSAAGGMIISNVNFSNPTPPFQPNATFPVTAQISSSQIPLAMPVNMTAQNNTLNPVLPIVPIVPTQNIGPGTGSTPIYTSTPEFTAPAVPAPSGTDYFVRFITGVNEPVYLKITEQGVTTWQTTQPGAPCQVGPYTLNHRHVASVKVEFFSDDAATLPLDVTGMGFRLVLEEGKPFWIYPTNPTTLTPVLSGTSYTFSPGRSYDEVVLMMGLPGGPGGGCPGVVAPSHFGYAIWQPFGSIWPSGITVAYWNYTPPPIPDILANPVVGHVGDVIGVSWTGGTATSCVGTNFSTGGALLGTTQVTLTALPTTFYINCSNNSGTGTDSVTVNYPPPQIIDFSANPQFITSGQSTTLTWSTTDATSCTSNDFYTGDLPNGSQEVFPPQATWSYSIICTGPGGSVDATVFVSTNP